jgi:all-trans-retinol 13,14-reductase
MSEKWDAIVIGSGIGGMTAATLLAMAKKKVLLLERHTVPGGFSHTFKRKGFEWDVGVHYVGQMQNPNSILKKIFDYITEGELKWSPLGEIYDEARILGKSYSFYSDFERHQKNLISLFPEEADAIKNYFKLVRSAAGSGPWFFGEKTMPWFLSCTLGKLLRWRFERFASKTTDEVLRSLTSNEELRSVLLTQCGDYGHSPDRSSFAIHAAVVSHYLDGASYPVGGAASIPDLTLKVFKRFGGSLRVKSDVREILTKDGRVTGVQLATGEIVNSPVVISNAGFRNTFSKLVNLNSVPTRVRDRLQSALSKTEPSTAHLCLYVGLDASDEQLKLPKNNIWVYDTRVLSEQQKSALTYISFPSAKDSAWKLQHPHKATVQVIRGADFSEVSAWKDEKWPRRNENYLELKRRWTEELKAKLLRELPHLEKHIVYTELSTPLSTLHFAGYSEGEIYGLSHTPSRFANRALRPQTPIKGLILTGQDIVTVGVGGALYSGVLAATVALKKSVIVRILAKRPL